MSESIMLGVSRPNKRFMDASPEQRGNIVNLGVLALDSIEVSKNTESDNKRNEYLEGVIAKLHLENTRLVEERELYVERCVANLKEKVEALSEFNKEKTEVQARHTHTLFELNKEKIEEQARHIHTLLELNKVLTEERSCANREFSSNTEKGRVGENMVTGYLGTIPGTKMSDKSDVAMCSDIWLEYGNTNILIECKNVKVVKKSEIDKFYRDVRMNSVDGAIFVSIISNVKIPHKHAFDVEILDGKTPCIFITGFENNQFVLYAAMQWLKLYKENCSQSDATMMKNILVGVLTEWRKQLTWIQKHKRTIQQMIDDVAQTEAQMNLALMNTGIPQPGICN
jgi:hypothetical protein